MGPRATRMSLAAKVNVSCAKNSIFNLQASCHPIYATRLPHLRTHTHTRTHTDTYTPLVNRPCPMAWAVCQLTRVPGRAPYADTYTCPRRSSFTPLRQLCCVLCAGGLRLCHCCLRLRLRCRCDPPHQRLRLLAEPRCRLPSVRLDRTIIVGNARKR